ncbi:MAG: hypothetical protein KF799_15150 [Bdellovibrionales bacterium]|nr:hypothetical protein [Bdellovibrionales bacterium]
MAYASRQLVDVFPITTSAFGLPADWFQRFSPKLLSPTYLLMILLLVASVVVMALRRFENADLEKKAWNIPVLLVVVSLWPALVLGVRDLVNTFNTFLIVDVFRIPWHGFGFPDIGSVSNFVGWSAEGVARLLPNLSYWIVYTFYIIFFFFYSVLGPFVLAKGILFDETEALLELLQELINLLLWQTTLVILVAFIMPDIVSGRPFPVHPEANIYFLSLILGVMIFFVPALTRKFVVQLGSAFVPLGFRWGGVVLGAAALSRVGGTAMSTVGISAKTGARFKFWRDRISALEEFRTRYEGRKKMQDQMRQRRDMELRLHEEFESDKFERGETRLNERDRLLNLSRQAKKETEDKP